MGLKSCAERDPVLRTRGGLPAIWLCQDATPQPSRHSLTNTLAARQVHQLQLGAHLLSAPSGAYRRGPRDTLKALW